VLTAITAAAAGNVTAGAGEFVQRTIVNLVQSKAAEGIKQLTDELGIAEGSPAHAALHAINACVGALAQNSNCGAAALGASSASVMAALIAESQGGAEKLTQEQREARQALVTTLVTGVAAASGNAVAANTAALIELENNSNVKNAVRAAINDSKAYLGARARQGGEKLAQLLEKIEIKPLVEMQKEISNYLIEAAARGGVSEAEVAVLVSLYAANELLFPTTPVDLVPGLGKVISKGAVLVKAGVRAEDAAKIVSAEAKAAEVAAKNLEVSVPHGFGSADEFAKFGTDIRTHLSRAGYQDVEPILQGSAASGRSFNTGAAFDLGRTSDFDIALASPTLLARAKELGIDLRQGGTRTGPLTQRDLAALGLREMANQMSKQAGRPVNFMVFQAPAAAIERAPSIPLPR
jgi:filamentous hemagglutinin